MKILYDSSMPAIPHSSKNALLHMVSNSVRIKLFSTFFRIISACCLFAYLMFFPLSPAMGQKMKKIMPELHNPKKIKKISGTLTNLFIENPDNILANYGLSVLATNPALPGKSTFKSWYHIRIAKVQYATLKNDTEKGEINKALPGALIAISKQYTFIDSSLWVELSTKPNLPFIQSSLYLLSDSKYFDQYITLRNNLEFESAKATNSIKSYNDFLILFPRAIDMAEAIRLKDKLELAEAQKKDIIFVYNDFISSHPLSVELSNAINLRDLKAYDLASGSEDLDEIDFFIYHYPTAPQVDPAITLRSKVAFNKARKLNTIPGFEEFIYHNPNTPYIPIALAQRDSIVYSEMQRLVSTSAFNEFMGGFPFAITAFKSFLDKYAVIKPKTLSALKQDPYGKSE